MEPDDVAARSSTISSAPASAEQNASSIIDSRLKTCLTAEQQESFLKFQKQCTQLYKGLDDSESKESREGIDDEFSLFRFFKARNLDPGKAYRHFEEAYQARKVNQTEGFYRDIEIKDFEDAAALYPKWTGRRDKRGLPICFFDLKNLNATSIAAHKSMPDSPTSANGGEKVAGMASIDVRRAYAVHDYLTRFVFPLCSAVKYRLDPESYITKQFVIADISGISLRKLWQIRGYMQSFSKLLSVNYPEILDRVLVIGAPSYFSTIWSWAQRWVDPVTFAKLELVKSADVFTTLSSYVDVEHIPQRYGGGFDVGPAKWPSLDRDICEMLAWRSSEKIFPPGPMLWSYGKESSKMALAVGSQNGTNRRCEVATLQ